MITVAVEIGGTFTDLVMAAEGRIVRTVKVPSTPRTPERGALAALDALDLPLEAIRVLVHGSTVATNAVLERKGASTIFLVTEGFRDILEIQREERENLYDLHYRKPLPLVSRDRVVPVSERLSVDGEVIVPLDEGAVLASVERLLESGVESIAICLLHAYRHTGHEDRLHALLSERLPGLHVSLSSRIVPEFREYERASTTVLNAYIAPIMEGYVKRMRDGLSVRGFDSSFRIVQSNGGVLPASQIAEQAVRVVLSGPAAGVMGAIRTASASGLDDLITFDMGGTSTDVCLVAAGSPSVTTESKIDGLPVRIPMIDIVTVGAGGGSIARLEGGRLLRVGPDSAGADPGPACYDRGGTAATVTDANLILGRIRPRDFFGGRMTLRSDLAEAAIGRIASGLGIDGASAAESMVKVANATMAQAIRLVSIERGHDPRDHTLVAFGGAGGLHAVALAEELEAKGVLVPTNAGVLSALGLLVAEFKRDYVQTDVRPVSRVAVEDIRARFAELESRALDEFAHYRIPLEGRRFEHVIDLRYLGQAYELSVPVDLTALIENETHGLVAAFHSAHAFRYGYASEDEVELVNYRLTASAAQQDITLESTGGQTRPPELARGRVFVDGAWQEGLFCRRDALPPGFEQAGPVVVEEDTATTFVPPRWQVAVDAAGNLRITRRQEP